MVTKYTNIVDPGTQIYKRDKYFKVQSLPASLKHYIHKEILLHYLITLNLVLGAHERCTVLCILQAMDYTCMLM